MTSNKIQRAINLVLAGKIKLERQPMYCLRAVRQVIEAANDWPGGSLYDRVHIWDHFTDTNRRLAKGTPWAASLEKAFMNQGWTVPFASARAGDVVFSRQPVNEGHVGILGLDDQGQLCVLENATIRRGRNLGGNLNWVPLALWGTPTTVGRLPAEWVFDPAPLPPPPVVERAPHRVIVASGQYDERGNMLFREQTGKRYTADLGFGLTLIVNATDPETVWVDVRKEKK